MRARNVLYFITFVCASEKPNIVFLLIDDLGFNDVAWHNSGIKMPNLESLAYNATHLKKYYVQDVCTPSRASIMTARYPIRYGLQHDVIYAPQPSCLSLNETIFPEELQKSGYDTYGIGKWHLGMYKWDCLPTRRGFDSFYGYWQGAETYFTKNVSFHPAGYAFGYDFWKNESVDWTAYEEYSTFVYATEAERIIHGRKSSQNPFFLYLPFQSVHFPLEVPQEYRALYPDEKDKDRQTYLGMISAMDEAVGRVIRALKSTGQYDNTIFAFSSDNGGLPYQGANNYPYRGWKFSLWEGGVRSPGFIAGPGIKPKDYPSLFHVVDWMPTLFDAAGLKRQVGTLPLDGVSHWDGIKYGEKKSPRDTILLNIDQEWYKQDPPVNFTEYKNPYFDTTIHAGLIHNNWKLLTGDPGHFGFYKNKTTTPNPFPSVHLFDLDSDPLELVNIADYFPSVVLELLQKLKGFEDVAAPIHFPNYDPRSNPKNHAGVWKPWAADESN